MIVCEFEWMDIFQDARSRQRLPFLFVVVNRFSARMTGTTVTANVLSYKTEKETKRSSLNQIISFFLFRLRFVIHKKWYFIRFYYSRKIRFFSLYLVSVLYSIFVIIISTFFGASYSF